MVSIHSPVHAAANDSCASRRLRFAALTANDRAESRDGHASATSRETYRLQIWAPILAKFATIGTQNDGVSTGRGNDVVDRVHHGLKVGGRTTRSPEP